MIWQDSFQQSAGEEGKLHWVRQLGGVMNIDSDLIFLSRNLSRISRREIGQSSLRGRQGWEKGLLVWFCFIFRWKKLSIFIIWERKLEEREMSMSRRERIINRVEVLKRYQGASSALNNLLVYCLANFPQIKKRILGIPSPFIYVALDLSLHLALHLHSWLPAASTWPFTLPLSFCHLDSALRFDDWFSFSGTWPLLSLATLLPSPSAVATLGHYE